MAGIDEAGRGPLAGPVVAAAVVFNGTVPSGLIGAIDDSKKLTAKRRESLFADLPAFADIGVGQASVTEIDQINILQATMLAMRRAVDALRTLPDTALIDGNRCPDLPCQTRAVVKGDARSLSIAAASIVAKVTRDQQMTELAAQFPGYGWDRNAGYPTKAHITALDRLGVTPHHRRSFAPVARVIERA